MPERVSGIVKAFDPAKGYGFITADDRELRRDVFYHVRDSARSTRNMVPGTRVTFRMERDDVGFRARDVERVSLRIVEESGRQRAEPAP